MWVNAEHLVDSALNSRKLKQEIFNHYWFRAAEFRRRTPNIDFTQGIQNILYMNNKHESPAFFGPRVTYALQE